MGVSPRRYGPQTPDKFPRKVLESFARDRDLYFAENDAHKRTDIVARQHWLLRQYLPAGYKLSQDDVIEMFMLWEA